WVLLAVVHDRRRPYPNGCFALDRSPQPQERGRARIVGANARRDRKHVERDVPRIGPLAGEWRRVVHPPRPWSAHAEELLVHDDAPELFLRTGCDLVVVAHGGFGRDAGVVHEPAHRNAFPTANVEDAVTKSSRMGPTEELRRIAHARVERPWI